MPIDPAGTTPGVIPETKDPDEVHIKCKSDGCDSIRAIEVKHAGQAPGTHMYRCIQCNRTWGIRTGGGIDLG